MSLVLLRFIIDIITICCFRSIDKETPRKQAKADEDMNWTDYHSLETIYDWIDELQQEFPQWITVEEIGRSYEGRPLKVVKLSKRQVLKIKLS